MFLTPTSRHPGYAYAVGLGMAVLAVLLQWSIRPWVGERGPFLFVLPALLLAALGLGRGPALLIMAAGAANELLWMQAHIPGSRVEPSQFVLLAAYLGISTLLVGCCGRLSLTSVRAAQAEERLALAQRKTGIGLFELDFQHGTAFVSPSLCRLLGQPAMQSTVPLRPWLARFDPRHVAETHRLLQKKIDLGELQFEHELHVRVDGELRWLLSRVRIEVAPNGTLACARGATMDITARKHVDMLLLQTQAELREQLGDLERLHGLSQRLMADLGGASSPLPALLELVVELHGAHQGLLSLGLPGDPEYRVAACLGLGAGDLQQIARMAPGDGPWGLAASTGRRVVVEDVQADERLRGWAVQAGFKAVHSLPLPGLAGEVIGVLSVLLPVARAPDAREIRLSDICITTAAALAGRERARAGASGRSCARQRTRCVSRWRWSRRRWHSPS
jgi:PAS domain-containing protein